MKICVLVKEVPDAAVQKRIDPGSKRLDRSGEKNLNPFDTHGIENGTIKRFALWDVTKQGELSVAVAAQLLEGKKLNVGDSFEVDGIGTVEVSPNSVQGYEYEAEGNGIVLMPERVVFTEENIGDFDF